jgi:hypothetical protein
MRKGRTTMNDNELIGSRNARREAPMRKVTPIPRRMRHLPCDERGFVVPWFACHDDTGRPHISLRDDEKWWEAVRRDRCWLCGQPLGVFKAFVATPEQRGHARRLRAAFASRLRRIRDAGLPVPQQSGDTAYAAC